MNAVRFVNLTKHAITLLQGARSLTIEPTYPAARIRIAETIIDTVNGFDVAYQVPQRVEHLPLPEPGVAYLVSRLVFESCPWRDDVYAPGPVARDRDRSIIGCWGLTGRPKRNA